MKKDVYKMLAAVLKKAERVWIQETDEGTYISDSYFIAKLDKYAFEYFKTVFNVAARNIETGVDFKKLYDGFKNKIETPAAFTGFSYTIPETGHALRMFYTENGTLHAVAEKYADILLAAGNTVYTGEAAIDPLGTDAGAFMFYALPCRYQEKAFRVARCA